MKTMPAIAFAVLCSVWTGYVPAEVLPASQKANAWYIDAESRLAGKLRDPRAGSAKNVIVFIGDGMGVSTLTAARIRQGQLAGKMGEEGLLSFETFPYTALVKTYNVDAQVPDSAGTMTAMMTGVKTNIGLLGVDENARFGVCATVAGNELTTVLELAEIKGLATGIVSTARLTHATPAATYAKSAERNWEDNSDLPDSALLGGCKDIADQLVNFEPYIEARFRGIDVDGIDVDGIDVDGIDVVLGGGRRHFLPDRGPGSPAGANSVVGGARTDGRDLTAEWQARYPTASYIVDQSGLDAIDTEMTSRLFGLFSESHMQFELDRSTAGTGEPSLAAMTETAIRILDNNKKGFFLMVEGGRIDHAHHAGNASRALAETIALADAVSVALATTNADETLIIVTADHSHVFTIAGYPKRGNPILGKVMPVNGAKLALDTNGQAYTTLGYSNGPGARDGAAPADADEAHARGSLAAGRNLSETDTTTIDYRQEPLVPLKSETHGGEDVVMHASGAGAYLIQGVVEQNLVYHMINHALQLIDRRD